MIFTMFVWSERFAERVLSDDIHLPLATSTTTRTSAQSGKKLGNGSVASMLKKVRLGAASATFGLLAIASFAAVANPPGNLASDVAQHFKGACPATLSESTFREYLASAGAHLKDVSRPGNPISVGASFSDRPVLASFFRSPFKCCVSMWAQKGSRESFVGWMMQEIPLREPRLWKDGDKKILIFAPTHTNRLISIDWDTDSRGSGELLNICMTEYSDALAAYGKLAATP
jgi:hypothetical protein